MAADAKEPTAVAAEDATGAEDWESCDAGSVLRGSGSGRNTGTGRLAGTTGVEEGARKAEAAERGVVAGRARSDGVAWVVWFENTPANDSSALTAPSVSPSTKSWSDDAASLSFAHNRSSRSMGRGPTGGCVMATQTARPDTTERGSHSITRARAPGTCTRCSAWYTIDRAGGMRGVPSAGGTTPGSTESRQGATELRVYVSWRPKKTIGDEDAVARADDVDPGAEGRQRVGAASSGAESACSGACGVTATMKPGKGTKRRRGAVTVSCTNRTTSNG